MGLFMPEAVGLHGAPVRMWKSLQGMKLGHTQYWQSGGVAEYVAERLEPGVGGVTSIRHTSPSRELPFRPDPAARELRELATVVDHAI